MQPAGASRISSSTRLSHPSFCFSVPLYASPLASPSYPARDVLAAETAAARLLDMSRKECCDPFAADHRRRLGGDHPPTHAPPAATCAGQYGVALARAARSSLDEPCLVVAWPRGVLA